MSNVPVTTTIDPELNERLIEYTNEENRHRSQVMRMALVDFLEAERNKPAITFALVDMMAFVNKMHREYADGKMIEDVELLSKKMTEDVELLSEKMAALLAAERG